MQQQQQQQSKMYSRGALQALAGKNIGKIGTFCSIADLTVQYLCTLDDVHQDIHNKMNAQQSNFLDI
jgi:hypothetical protein